MARSRQRRIVKNTVLGEIERENARITREKAEQERLEREVRARKAETGEKEKRRYVTLADCGSSPKISSGPCFSSTYNVAATDAARHSGLFCVKTIEGVSAAPNPFGGNAARARFTGHCRDFELTSVVKDFFY